MATITLTIPNAAVPRVRAALCAAAQLPETDANAKQAIVDWVKATVALVENTAAGQARPPIVEADVSGVVS